LGNKDPNALFRSKDGFEGMEKKGKRVESEMFGLRERE